MLLLLLALSALFVPAQKPPEMTEAETTAAKALINSGDVAWMLTASALVLLMTPASRSSTGAWSASRTVVSTMLQSVVALGVISMVWVLIGYSLALGQDILAAADGIIGKPSPTCSSST